MYRHLDSLRITETIKTLQNRISERFPDSGLGKVCAELCEISRDTEKRCEWITKPHKTLRVGIFIVVAVILGILILAAVDLNLVKRSTEFLEFVQILEAGMNAAYQHGGINGRGRD